MINKALEELIKSAEKCQNILKTTNETEQNNIISFEEDHEPRHFTLNVKAEMPSLDEGKIFVKWCTPDLFTGGVITLAAGNYNEKRPELVKAEAIVTHYLLSVRKVFGELQKKDEVYLGCGKDMIKAREGKFKSVRLMEPRDEKYFGFMNVKYRTSLKLDKRTAATDFYSLKVIHDERLSTDEIDRLYYSDNFNTVAGEVFVSLSAINSFAKIDTASNILDLFATITKQMNNKLFEHKVTNEETGREVWGTQGSRYNYRLENAVNKDDKPIKILVDIYERAAVRLHTKRKV
ncbi:hypothetical protein [Moritella sp. F3]|uniref:hypothetical protein n=1 Tax=Moritella sp. F3 TaxID=2718882 RepID=UPI0018E13B23|nr:hypothetical protein [Moritella sp. F3]GIC77030.1 hypothetical protein FMO001_17570 [Moritella sp. F1]GIC82149.1 hypothetical protein FMO003_24300 [Moritella sp. F3]